MEKENFESIFISPNADFGKAIEACQVLGYKFLIEITPYEGQLPCAWVAPDIDELLETCAMINETHSYKIHLLETALDWNPFSSN